jgi:hypothetical protein
VAFKIPVNPVPLAVGLVVVLCAVGGVLYMQRGAHIELSGAILKVRTQAMDENSSIAVVDFRFVNSSDYNFVVREVGVTVEDKDGKTIDGATVSELDARRLFEYYPQLGQKFNDTLIMKSKIPPHQSMDRMIVARFEVPESQLDARKDLTVRVVDVDGPTSELREKK